MTREKCKEMLPVIQAFADGEYIEFYDTMSYKSNGSRGMWKTADDIGFGCSIRTYRMIKNDEIIYFDKN